MLHLLHDFDLTMDIAQIVLICKDALIDHLDCDISFIHGVPTEIYRGVGAFTEEMVQGENVFLNLLLAF